MFFTIWSGAWFNVFVGSSFPVNNSFYIWFFFQISNIFIKFWLNTFVFREAKTNNRKILELDSQRLVGLSLVKSRFEVKNCRDMSVVYFNQWTHGCACVHIIKNKKNASKKSKTCYTCYCLQICLVRCFSNFSTQSVRNLTKISREYL